MGGCLTFLPFKTANISIIVLFVETPRKFITAKLSIRKPVSSSVLIICDLFNSHTLFIYKSAVIIYILYIKRACELNKSHVISTDEDPGLQIESFAVINLCGVSTNKTIIYLIAMQTYKKQIYPHCYHCRLLPVHLVLSAQQGVVAVADFGSKHSAYICMQFILVLRHLRFSREWFLFGLANSSEMSSFQAIMTGLACSGTGSALVGVCPATIITNLCLFTFIHWCFDTQCPNDVAFPFLQHGDQKFSHI